MKKIIITLTLSIAAHGVSQGQVSKSTFNNSIAALSRAIDDKALKIQNVDILMTIKLMNDQISYLQTTNNSARKTDIANDKLIKIYVSELPNDKIVVNKTELMNRLKAFAATCE